MCNISMCNIYIPFADYVYNVVTNTQHTVEGVVCGREISLKRVCSRQSYLIHYLVFVTHSCRSIKVGPVSEPGGFLSNQPGLPVSMLFQDQLHSTPQNSCHINYLHLGAPTRLLSSLTFEARVQSVFKFPEVLTNIAHARKISVVLENLRYLVHDFLQDFIQGRLGSICS